MVSTPDSDMFMITSEELMKEVKFATHRNLSLNAAAKEVGITRRHTTS